MILDSTGSRPALQRKETWRGIHTDCNIPTTEDNGGVFTSRILAAPGVLGVLGGCWGQVKKITVWDDWGQLPVCKGTGSGTCRPWSLRKRRRALSPIIPNCDFLDLTPVTSQIGRRLGAVSLDAERPLLGYGGRAGRTLSRENFRPTSTSVNITMRRIFDPTEKLFPLLPVAGLLIEF